MVPPPSRNLIMPPTDVIWSRYASKKLKLLKQIRGRYLLNQHLHALNLKIKIYLIFKTQKYE